MEPNERPNRPRLFAFGLFNLICGPLIAVVGVILSVWSFERAAAEGEGAFVAFRGLVIIGVIQFGVGFGQLIESLFGEKWHGILGWGCLLGVLALPFLAFLVYWLTK